MLKPTPRTPPTSEAPPPRDWFMAAIDCDGSVSDCLGAVLAELGQRSAFVAALNVNLALGVAPGGAAVDAITDLGQRLRGLENTLRFRLGILRPERPAAWFRAPAATSTGPFQSTLLEEPVFGAYEAAAAAAVRSGLDLAWREHRAEGLPFKDSGGCLWRTLLQCRARLEQVVQLPEPFSGLRLDMLPDGLPLALESRALCAFLLNVRAEVRAAAERLGSCHQQLLETSEKLWAVQIEAARLSPASQPRQTGERVRSQAADDLREEFKRRRSAALRSYLTPADMDALKFMGFEGLPSQDELRQRYLAMAKRLHPDRQGGSDQAFKILVSAYSQLERRVETVAR